MWPALGVRGVRGVHAMVFDGSCCQAEQVPVTRSDHSWRSLTSVLSDQTPATCRMSKR